MRIDNVCMLLFVSSNKAMKQIRSKSRILKEKHWSSPIGIQKESESNRLFDIYVTSFFPGIANLYDFGVLFAVSLSFSTNALDREIMSG